MKKLSVIVPVYNVEKYIERCVRSLMEQTLDDIEFIFVNDCTPDNSMNILRQTISDYPERLSQIRIIEHTTNLGVTQSRKDGLTAAQGEYVGWCDSDDWVEADMFKTMYSQTDNGEIDIVVCNYTEYLPDREPTVITHAVYETPGECIRNSYKSNMSGLLWNQLCRKRLLCEHINDIIPVDYSEDTFLVWHLYYHARSIRFIDKSLYNYNKENVYSLIHNIDMSYQAWKKQEENLERITNLYFSNGGKRKYHIAINAFKFYRKNLFRPAFKTRRQFFNTFRESSRDIIFFRNMTFMNKWKTFLVNNIYILFRSIL